VLVDRRDFGMFEPSRGQFRWGWLDKAMSTLGDRGLKIVQCEIIRQHSLPRLRRNG
jgi:hypothetical protein